MTVIDPLEEKVVKGLIGSSGSFRDYYENERLPMKMPISWLEDNLDRGLRAQASRRGEIRLQQIPPPNSDAHTVAHEIHHIVLWKVFGVYSATAKQSYKGIAATLNSSVLDLRIERDLFKYGFDIRVPYEKDVSDARLNLQHHRQSPTNYLDRLNWIINYAGTRADFDLLSRTYKGFSDRSFFEWFRKKYSDIATESNKVYKKLTEVDLDSNDSIKNYLRWVIDYYRLPTDIWVDKIA
ncbi:hypothetical protein [Chryseolinea soli]|uniref:Uncharacterized protein n=1 Tax=Chryseolinea soli TaxID=2321403 RepID=A0A385SYW1_9BACT|nr:hypothetical protein [Chryseolinea soli]AYB35307.1 hypothetical protein D4L85_34075 [Chryseolinea soli]